MRLFQYLTFSTLLLLFVGCKEVSEKEKSAVDEATFISIPSPAKVNSSLPYLISNEYSTLLSWVMRENDSLAVLKYTELKDGQWQEAKEIIRGSDWFVNWADYPMIAENNGNLWSHVLKKSSTGTYSYDVKMNLRAMGISDWKTDMPLHSDLTPTEHGFVSVLDYEDDFFVTWLDGRNTEEKEGEERGSMTLRAARVSPSGVITNEQELDYRTCDCCQTTAAITNNGPVVLYRDRSDEEVRDISIVRLVNGEWTKPLPIANDNWQIKGCPVNGPKVAAWGNTLAAAWFTAADQIPIVKLAFSQDAGASFGSSIEIATGSVLGRVDVALLDAQTALVSWMETENKRTELKVMRVARSGERSKTIVVSTMNGSRQSGFPQMEVVGDKVYFAYTDVINGSTQIKTGYIPVSKF